MWNYTRNNLKKLFRWLLMLDDTPHSIALGAAVGIFVTFTPTVGLHMALVVALSLVIRMNRAAALTTVWVNNPFTLIPVFFINYLIGAVVCRMEPMTWHNFESKFAAAFSHESWFSNLGEVFLAIGRVALDIAVPLWVGSLIVAVGLSVPTYFIVRRLAERYRARKAAGTPGVEGPCGAACPPGPSEAPPIDDDGSCPCKDAPEKKTP